MMSPTSCELILKVRRKPLPTPDTNPVYVKINSRKESFEWVMDILQNIDHGLITNDST